MRFDFEKLRDCKITQITQRFLRWAMVWIAAISLVILKGFLEADGSAALHLPYSEFSEYILASVAIAVIGAVLIERVLREQ